MTVEMIEVKGVVRSPTFFHLTQLFIGKQTFRQVFILAKLHSLFQQIILLQLKIVKHTHTHTCIRKTLPEAQRTQGKASKLELSLQLMVAPLALVPNLATRWRHLHEVKNWPQDGATCIS